MYGSLTSRKICSFTVVSQQNEKKKAIFQKCLTTHTVPYLSLQCKVTHCEQAVAILFVFAAKKQTKSVTC